MLHIGQMSYYIAEIRTSACNVLKLHFYAIMCIEHEDLFLATFNFGIFGCWVVILMQLWNICLTRYFREGAKVAK